MYYFTSKIGTTSLQGIKLLKSLPAKVAEFEDAGLRVEKKVLRLYVSVAHSVGMDIGQGPEQLVHVHLREGVCVWRGGGGGGGGSDDGMCSGTSKQRICPLFKGCRFFGGRWTIGMGYHL